MSNIVLILFVSIAVLAGMMAFSIWYLNFILRMMIGRKNEMIDYILKTSCVPQSWVQGFPPKGAIPETGEQKVTSAYKRTRRRVLHKLDELIKYLRSTTMVESEEARQELICQLLAVRKGWESEGGLFCENQREALGR